jgi:general secretion pathway protein G
MCKLNKNQGFTLIELLIVMAIIGMLAAIVGPKLFNKFVGAQRDATASQISGFDQALSAYRLDVGKYPDNLEALIKNDGSKRWKGPYLQKQSIPKDPWGNEYQYRKPGQHNNDYDLFSFGADGQEGGDSDNADIVNWK